MMKQSLMNNLNGIWLTSFFENEGNIGIRIETSCKNRYMLETKGYRKRMEMNRGKEDWPNCY